MAPKDIIYNGYKFVPNNYAAILDKDVAPSEFNFVQDFLQNSEIGFALTQPQSISTEQVVRFWSTGYYDDTYWWEYEAVWIGIYDNSTLEHDR